MKRVAKILAILLSISLIFGCTSTPKEKRLPPVKRESGVEYQVTLLHTNDHHGATLSKDGKFETIIVRDKFSYLFSLKSNGRIPSKTKFYLKETFL